MKVLAILAFVFASASAKGSGPYLPRGWRPDGPSFYLPSEVKKPVDSTVRDTIFAGSETSSSDALREYGPPKVEYPSQSIVNQGLPDVDVEQNFIDAVFATKDDEKGISTITLQKEILENPKAVLQPESILQTDSNVENLSVFSGAEPNEKVQVTTEEISERANNIPSIEVTEFVTESNPSEEFTTSQPIQETTLNEQDTAITNQEDEIIKITKSSENVLQQSESTTAIYNAESQDEVLKQIEEQITTSEKIIQNVSEVPVEVKVEAKSDVGSDQAAITTSLQETFGSAENLPEGFLEYGPPGFQEYGPPKDELTTENIQSKIQQDTNDINLRRRRFSPKFKSTKHF